MIKNICKITYLDEVDALGFHFEEEKLALKK